MPYRINWGKRYVVFAYYGDVTANDILESNQIVYGDERFDALRWEFVCFDEAETISFTRESVRVVAYMDQGAAISNPNITVVFVGASETLDKVNSCYAQVDGQRKWTVKSCETRDQAIELMERATAYGRRAPGP